MANLILTFSDLYNKVSKFLGTYGSSGVTGTDLTDAKEIVNDAYRRFLIANPCWSFLSRDTTLTTVNGTSVYQLPPDFLELKRIFQFGANANYPLLEETSSQQIDDWRNLNDISSYPSFFAIGVGEYTKETGQIWEVTFYPKPDAAYTLSYSYKMSPAKMEDDDDIPIGGLEYSDCIRQLCLAEAESNMEENSGVQEQKAAIALQLSLLNDKRKAPHNLGYNGDGGRMSSWDVARGSYRINDVSFNT
jgi:hypothetical protein